MFWLGWRLGLRRAGYQIALRHFPQRNYLHGYFNYFLCKCPLFKMCLMSSVEYDISGYQLYWFNDTFIDINPYFSPTLPLWNVWNPVTVVVHWTVRYNARASQNEIIYQIAYFSILELNHKSCKWELGFVISWRQNEKFEFLYVGYFLRFHFVRICEEILV